MFQDFLESNKNGNIVKVAIGAGTDDPSYIENAVYIFAKAGVQFFDVSAHQSSIDAARKAALKAKKDIYICTSLGIPGDPHADKAEIKKRKCVNCGKCVAACPNDAIIQRSICCEINIPRCVGCAKCFAVCPTSAISMASVAKPVKDIVPTLSGMDTIELHMAGDIEYGLKQWEELEGCFDGPLSVHINRTVCGDIQLMNTLHRIVDRRKPWSTTIQADGMSMRGGDSMDSTLQAIAIMQIIEKEKLPAYLISSGGTNCMTAHYMREFKVRFDGIAYGTYARNIIKPYLAENEDEDTAIRKIRHLLFGEEFRC